MMTMSLTVLDIADRIPAEAVAYECIEQLCWPNGAICPHYGSTAADYIGPLRCIASDSDGCHVGAASVALRAMPQGVLGPHGYGAAGTKIAVRKWILVFFEMASSKNGVAAREIERKYDLTPKWHGSCCTASGRA